MMHNRIYYGREIGTSGENEVNEMKENRFFSDQEYTVLDKEQLEYIYGGVGVKKTCKCRKCGTPVEYGLYVKMAGLCSNCYKNR